MLYKNDIANMALRRLGVASGGNILTVGDFTTDNTPQGRIIRAQFRDSLDTSLEYHPWTFAKGWLSLPLVEEDPTSGYKFSYSYPPDALVIRRIGPGYIMNRDETEYEKDKLRWEEVLTGGGMRIHTNVAKCFAEYTRRIPEDSGFPNHFGRAVSAQLALDIAAALITNNYPKIKSALISGAGAEFEKGVAYDLGRQPLPKEPEPPFLQARYE